MLQQGPARVVVGEALKTLTNEGNNSVLMKGVSAGLYRLTAYRRVNIVRTFVARTQMEHAGRQQS